MTNNVTHFEIYAEDPAKLVDFYRSLFGWQLEKLPGLDYWRIQTNGDEGQSIGGGMLHRPIAGPKSWVHYVHVDSVDDAVSRVLGNGGSVIREKTAVPKMAWYAVLADPEGNIFSVWQSDPSAFPPLKPEI